MGDKSQGLYRKFEVSRTDGTSGPGQKHYGCEYFVLDLDHDPFAAEAIRAYAEAAENEYLALATDIREKIGVPATEEEYILRVVDKDGEIYYCSSSDDPISMFGTQITVTRHRLANKTEFQP